MTVFLGSILFSLGPMVTALTINFSLWCVVLSYGVLSSMGQNIAILPTLNLPMAWFPEKRGLMSGMSIFSTGRHFAEKKSNLKKKNIAILLHFPMGRHFEDKILI